MRAKWGEITAGDIIAPIRGELMAGARETVLGGLSTDSRTLAPGQLFWALRGEKYDGHDFLGEALEKGAGGVVVRKDSRPKIPRNKEAVIIAVTDTLIALGDLANWWRRRHPVPVAAITGSVGKTTTKEMAAGILAIRAATLKNEGNLNNLIGVPLTLLQMEEGHQRAVLEMGMNRPGEIARLTEIAEPNIGLITNVGRAHLEGLGDVQAVARAKAELMEKMAEDGHAILNGDDDLLMRVASPLRKEVTTYGLGPKNGIRADKIQSLGTQGTVFELQFFGHTQPIRLHVPGLQNVLNALAASAIAIRLEEPTDSIRVGLARFKGLEGRFMVTSLPGGALLVDDTYNANPASLRAALDSLKGWTAARGRLIVGLGDMLELGEETAPAHLEAGRLVAEMNAFHFLAIGEQAPLMIDGALRGGLPRERTTMVESHEEMIKAIKAMMNEGVVIFLKASRKIQLEKVARALREMPPRGGCEEPGSTE